MTAAHAYGTKSLGKLTTCHPQLGTIARRALILSPYDITIIHGWRGKELQDQLVAEEKSRTPWPLSRHNSTKDPRVVNPNEMSDALDFAPWINGDIPWDDTHIFAVVAGCFFAAAQELGAILTWGGDWDSDGSTKDQTLLDWGHVQLEHRGVAT